MKRKEVINLYRNLNSLGALKGVKFSYGVSKNMNLLKSEVESIEKAITASEEFIVYDKARVQLAKEFAEKNEKGEPIVKGQEYVIRDEKKFEKELKKLQEEHKEVLEARKQQIDDYAKLLEEEIEVKVHKIKLEDVPADISTQQMNGIVSIIEE